MESIPAVIFSLVRFGVFVHPSYIICIYTRWPAFCFRRFKYWFETQNEGIFNLNESKMAIMILFAMFNVAEFSKL